MTGYSELGNLGALAACHRPPFALARDVINVQFFPLLPRRHPVVRRLRTKVAVFSRFVSQQLLLLIHTVRQKKLLISLHPPLSSSLVRGKMALSITSAPSISSSVYTASTPKLGTIDNTDCPSTYMAMYIDHTLGGL